MRTRLLLFLMLLPAIALAQVRLGVAAQPWLEYTGGLIGGDAPSPTFSGVNQLPLGFDLARYKPEQAVWKRYRLQMAWSVSKDRNQLPALDNELEFIPGETVVDNRSSSDLFIALAIERERIKGSKSLKGIWGRGVSAELAHSSFNQSLSNPLGSYVGDTLSFSTGYSFRTSLYLHSGVQYQFSPAVSVMARLAYGVQFDYIAPSSMRTIQQNGSDVEVERSDLSPGGMSWRMDAFFRPGIILNFTFD
jgi:hypothetical protein